MYIFGKLTPKARIYVCTIFWLECTGKTHTSRAGSCESRDCTGGGEGRASRVSLRWTYLEGTTWSWRMPWKTLHAILDPKLEKFKNLSFSAVGFWTETGVEHETLKNITRRTGPEWSSAMETQNYVTVAVMEGCLILGHMHIMLLNMCARLWNHLLASA